MSSAGRPTKLDESMQQRADHYVTHYREAGDIVPSRAGLACHLGVSRETLARWSKRDERFRGTLKRLSDHQERMAWNGGLSGEFNAPITKLLLANHGYSDRVAQDNTSSDGSMSPASAEDTAQAVLNRLQSRHDQSS